MRFVDFSKTLQIYWIVTSDLIKSIENYDLMALFGFKSSFLIFLFQRLNNLGGAWSNFHYMKSFLYPISVWVMNRKLGHETAQLHI